jgi:hypothetical protein
LLTTDVSFFRALSQSREKSLLTYVMSVCPSVRMI